MAGKLKAFTILESLVAMIIIAFSMGTAGVIYVNTMSSNDHVRKNTASVLGNQASFDLQTEQANFSTETMTVEKRVSGYEGVPGLKYVHIEVRGRSGKLLCEKDQLVFDNE